jgi:hypothetical protein
MAEMVRTQRHSPPALRGGHPGDGRGVVSASITWLIVAVVVILMVAAVLSEFASRE